MNDNQQKDLLLHDPLSDVTRKERRMLLGVSMIAVFLVKTSLVPTKISALGVEFDQANQHAFLSLISLITIYFMVAFSIYAAADFLAWRKAIYNYMLIRRREFVERNKDLSKLPIHEEKEIRDGEIAFWENAKAEKIIFILSGPVSIIRAAFEFLLPLIVGIYANYLLLRAVGRI